MLSPLAALLAFAAPVAQAHMSGHGTLDEDQILVVASNAAAWLSKNEVEKDWSPLPASWAEIPASQVKIIARVDGDFVVSVRNDAERAVLYMLIAGDGGVMDANFTGVFPVRLRPRKADGRARLGIGLRRRLRGDVRCAFVRALPSRRRVEGAIDLTLETREQERSYAAIRCASDIGVSGPSRTHGKTRTSALEPALSQARTAALGGKLSLAAEMTYVRFGPGRRLRLGQE